MKILHTVEFYYPSIGGSQEVVRQISERMAQAGHDITVATSYLPNRTVDSHNGVKIRSFNISGNEVRGYEGETKSYVDFIKSSNFDVIMNYAAQQWTADLIFPLLPNLRARKIFVPCGFSGLHDPAYEDYFNRMPKILRKYDATIYLAEKYRDIDFAKKHRVKHRYLIPNGADENEFNQEYSGEIKKKLGIREDRTLILHVGGFTGVKGQREAIEIFEASELSHATLLLVGNILDKELVRRLKCNILRFKFKQINRKRHRNILIKHLDRPETVATMHASDLFLFPSNIEASPLVLFEACASKTPFLTTDVGNSKEIIRWTDGGVLLPTSFDSQGNSHADIEGSAKVLEKIIGDVALRQRLAYNGFHAWNTKYRWDKLAQAYVDVYKGVV